MRTRDAKLPTTDIRLHGPDGARVGAAELWYESTITKPIEFKADEAAMVYVGVSGGVRDSAFDFSVR